MNESSFNNFLSDGNLLTQEAINVLSCFDGMSCLQIALEKAGIPVNKYFASEIDKYAMQVTQANYPNTIQVGNVEFVTKEMLNNKIHLLAGGSPCQGFSFAGKQLNFEDPRSKLFFEFVRLKRDLKPKYFFLENVRMKKEYQDVISSYLGCEPVMINSSLVSAQNRVRLYWTNIPGIEQPKDKGILLKDIIIPDLDFSEYVYPKDKTIHKLFNTNPSNKGMNGCVYWVNGKAPTLTTNKGEGIKILVVPEATKKGFTEVNYEEGVDLTFINSKTRRGRLMKYKSNCLTATTFDYYWYNNNILRKLTPVECERLQTVPDDYTNCVSNSQRYKMLGNGWTIDVIIPFLKNMSEKKEGEKIIKTELENRTLGLTGT